ncbi:WxL domain-containing protein [Enterococcus sp. DIV0806c]|uniref:WxL domain-containing protein n=1 Tax=Enterococcus sp. DIV0806c TaxID=2774869 RepID=UPI003F25D6D5
MRKLMKKGMLILGTMILVLHAFLLPVGIVYAETTDKKEEGQVQEEEQLELPSIKNYPEVKKEGNPRFSFPRSRLQGTVEEPLKVTFVSDQEVTEARITLPKEAKLVKDQLQAGVAVNQEEESDEWVIQAERAQQTFVLPVVFKAEGNYDVSVEDVTATLEISEKEEPETEDQSEMNQDSSDESNEEHEQYPNTTEQSEEKGAPVATEESKEEATPSENETFKQAVFDGNTEEVSTMAAFREAVANPEVSIISVQANLTENTANIMTIDRPIKIQGNGHTLTFGNTGFYFQFEDVEEETTFRIENATIAKIGTTPLMNASSESSRNWTIELEDITALNANELRLVSSPEGKLVFTGGQSNFQGIAATTIFIEAKEISAINQARVTINRGNSTVFFSGATITNPKLIIENGSTITITTSAGAANTIDFRGENPEISISSNSQLTVTTGGTGDVPSDIINNAVVLTGVGPKILINSESRLTITTTAAKRGIHLSGDTAKLTVNDSELIVTSASQSAVDITGNTPVFSTKNSTIQLTSTTGTALNVTGRELSVNFDTSTVRLSSTSGQRINLLGDAAHFKLSNTQMVMTSSTGRGLYMQGETPQVRLDNSQLTMTDTGDSQGMILQGPDALLSLENESEFILTGAGVGTSENIQIGNNNDRPELSVTGASTLSVSTTSGAVIPTETANNALHLRGTEPKATISGGSKLNVSVTSYNRRGFYLNGENAELEVSNSQLNVRTAAGQALSLLGLSPIVKMIKSSSEIETTTGIGVDLSGDDALFQLDETKSAIRSSSGQRMNLIGATPTLSMVNSQLEMAASTGRGIYLQGVTPQVLLNNSQLTMTDTGDSQGMILQGTDALLSLDNQSEFNLNSSGLGYSENIQIGNNNARPELSVIDGSKLSVTTTSSAVAATNAANNVLHLRGDSPKIGLLDSKINVDITSGNRRGLVMTGNTSQAIIENSELETNVLNGTSFYSDGNNGIFEIKNSTFSSETVGGDNISQIGNNNNLSINNSSEVSLKTTSGRNIYAQGNTNVVNIASNSKVNINSVSASSIWLNGSYPKLDISDAGTEVTIASSAAAVFSVATVYLGTGVGVSPGAEINVSDEASVEITSNMATTIGLWSENAQFNISEKAELLVKQGASSEPAGGAAAAVRFMQFGNSSFTIDDAKMSIEKTGGSTPGMRMFGNNNSIMVKNGGEFSVYNPGNGTANDGGIGVNNQGISYPGGTNNSFSIEGIGSNVNIIAESGPALDMGTSSPTLDVKNGGIFRAEGRTASATAGVFSAAVINVNFENPLYMNFQNNRPGGGNIFNVNNGSTLKATNSDLSVWKNGADLAGDPDLDFRSIDYSFGGANFNLLGETSAPDQLNTDVFGNTGLTAYSRLSSNNGRWAIADELRVPTNADKKIYGRVSLPVGLDDSRPAWDDEAIVTVEVESPSGHTQDYTTKTVGHSDESPGISIYGEDPRGGLFEITLPEPLEAGSKVRISHVELTSGELTEGFDHQILTDTVEVFPIVPPAPAKFSSSIIGENSKTIQGISENKEAEVTATYNGQPFDTSDATINDEGRFTLDLSELSLQEDDEIQIFLRDNAGSAKAAEVVAPPETNNDRGNINPATELLFHDVTFEPATILTVGNLGPVSPVDPMNPEIEVDPENKPELEEDQGLLSIDFASRFTFGQQAISTRTKRYYAQPQRLLNPDGTVNEAEERPNYIQISDRRPEEERHGWQLAVTQNSQFTDLQENELRGARLSFTNQQLESIHGSDEPMLYAQDGVTLIPGEKTKLLTALDGQGAGTWIYRFGDGESASESVALEVPPTANPRASTYETTLTWELSVVPDN